MICLLIWLIVNGATVLDGEDIVFLEPDGQKCTKEWGNIGYVFGTYVGDMKVHTVH